MCLSINSHCGRAAAHRRPAVTSEGSGGLRSIEEDKGRGQRYLPPSVSLSPSGDPPRPEDKLTLSTALAFHRVRRGRRPSGLQARALRKTYCSLKRHRDFPAPPPPPQEPPYTQTQNPYLQPQHKTTAKSRAETRKRQQSARESENGHEHRGRRAEP
jgi:hypothetical protein